jgi:VWFA-related protein
VSLGLAIDTSGSMSGEKIVAAREALRRFLEDLTRADDEVFVYRFGREPVLVQDWTTDRALLRERLAALRPIGDTSLYDTVVRSLARARTGRHMKKALVVISDGNDSHSYATANDVRLAARETEVLVYAVGIGTERRPGASRPADPGIPDVWPPIPDPAPFPGTPPRRPTGPQSPLPPGPRLPYGITPYAPDREVNAQALREMTDESGGRTEVVRWASDLGPATARIADELNRQYALGYVAAAPRDGRWHDLRVEVPGRDYVIRARKGYVAGTR